MVAGALLARDASVAKANHFAPGISVDIVVTHLETADSTAVRAFEARQGMRLGYICAR